jgi:hypothetical protein
MESEEHVLPPSFSELSAEPLPSAMSSLYLWDACRHGKLFAPESYEIDSIQKWIEGLATSAMSSMILPHRFDPDRVAQSFKDTILKAFRESALCELFSSADPKDIGSVERLVKESADRGRLGFENLIQFLRQDEFPPILWLELGRYARLSTYVMNYLGKRMKRLSSLRPKHRAEVMRRSKQAWSMSKSYGTLSVHLTNAFLGVLRIFLFLEFWSCEKEEELFGDKPWAFKNIDPAVFEDMMFKLHFSIDELSNNFLQFESLEVGSDFSEPIGWAFKQLVQIA